ncbi:CbiX/SirB N-terminal domain-containing protein [Comamonadaceae bacterium M7527]|nr:CbiX/SirB N-terminal domain-containing protein [Comamonadaceae bacterium M7527]
MSIAHQSASAASKGLILFAHGSRDPLWRDPLEAMATNIAKQTPDTQVACAYLELCEPDLPAVAADMINHGAKHIRVLPMFFGVGKHAREDLPVLMQQLQDTHPNVQFVCEQAVGQHPALEQAIAAIAATA